MILVVDDDMVVLQTTTEMLRRSGFEAVEAAGGLEALQVLESSARVTVLLTDCDMPVVSGSNLARQVIERWPHIGIIAMSGQPRPADMPLQAGFIAKPFRAAALAAMVRALSYGAAEGEVVPMAGHLIEPAGAHQSDGA
jgi:CheY-like chemotaxis protein